MNRNYIENTLKAIDFLLSVCDVEPEVQEFKPCLERYRDKVLEARTQSKTAVVADKK
jgi:hypothetical protein